MSFPESLAESLVCFRFARIFKERAMIFYSPGLEILRVIVHNFLVNERIRY